MEYKHFSHEHALTLYKVEAGQQFRCHGCNLACKDSIFACWGYNFFLHNHCANSDRHLNHPSHPPHPLVLLPSPTYCSASFLCNACGTSGSSFSYSCTLCEYDLHIPCAYLPPRMRHMAYPHELSLNFSSSNGPKPNDCCRLCGKEMSSTQWCYLCETNECGFRVHTYCGTNEVKPGDYQGNSVGVQAGPNAPENVRTEAELTPAEVILEVGRMQMELQMAHALANIIAYR